MKMFPAAFVLSVVLPSISFAQVSITVLTDAERKAADYYAALLQEAYGALDERLEQHAKLQTPEEIAAEQKRFREFFVEQLGGFPERSPLNAKTVKVIPADGYRIECVIFDSQPNHHITANLYLPDSDQPVPGVVVSSGHSRTAKTADYNQRFGIAMARHGMAALCFDPIGQGERSQFVGADGKNVHGGTTTEHFLVGVGSILVGRNTARYRVWDAMRAIDYLQSRPEIQADKIGMTGCSGGGTLTSYAMALDDRVTCAAPACYLTTFRQLISTLGPQDSEQNIFGQIAFGMDQPDYVLMRAPKPTLISSTTEDFFSVAGSWENYRQSKRIYGKLGYPERVDLVETDGGHGVTPENLSTIAHWMQRWLRDVDEPVDAIVYDVLTEEELLCTETGQALTAFEGEKSVVDLNANLAEELAAERQASGLSPDVLRAQIAELLAIGEADDGDAPEPTTVEHRDRIDRGDYQVLTVLLRHQGRSVPGMVFQPPQPTGELCIYLSDEGKMGGAQPFGPVERLVQAGTTVVTLDLSAQGETASNKRDALLTDWKTYFLSYLLGKSLLGTRVEDAIAAAEYSSQRPQADGERRALRLIGSGTTGSLVALHAAALRPELFASIGVYEQPKSWTDVVGSLAPAGQLENAVHRALYVYDVPDLIALAGPDKLEVLPDPDPRPADVKTLLAGVSLTPVAEHPDLATPTGIDVDDEGRVWSVATHTHFRPDDYVGPEHDEVLVFRDSVGDGRLDSRVVFYDKTDATMDLELGPDGWVYLAERDRVLRVKDSDGDSVGDVEEVLLTLTTEADYPHNGLEGLAWHPSGDLVLGLGENFAKPWTLVGPDGLSVTGTGEGGIFRCRPDGTGLRRIAYGFWNPFGICVRSDGEMFAAENDPGERPPCRLLHIVEGGDYGYQRVYGGEAHHPFVGWNGELRGTLPMIHPSGEAPCGVLPLGNGLLVPSWSDHRLDFFALRRKGASFDAERKQLVQGSRYFRPSCIAQDRTADGRKLVWYLNDWVDGRYQAHGYGRIWRLEIDLDEADWVGELELEPPTEDAKLASRLRGEPDTFDEDELLRLAKNDDPFVARAALVALAPRLAVWDVAAVASWPVDDHVTAVQCLKLAGADAAKWVPSLLSNSNPAVQFETLRWIADAELEAFRSDVEQLLSSSELTFEVFEAAVATINRLDGTPEQGTRHPELLLARVLDADSASSLRAFALRLLPKHRNSPAKDGSQSRLVFPEGLTLDLLAKLSGSDDEQLSIEAIRTLADVPTKSGDVLAAIAADNSRSVRVRAEAIVGLAGVADKHAEMLVGLAASDDQTVRDEALRALRGKALNESQLNRLGQVSAQYPDSEDAVIALASPETLKADRPAGDALAEWQSRLATVPGEPDIEAGGRLFHNSALSQCANCHRHGGRGSVVGPDLSAVGRNTDDAFLLSSILQPSARMAPEYQPRTVVLTDGRVFTGIRLRSSTKEALRDTNGQNVTFDRDEIESMVESSVSFMPTGLEQRFTDRELRDLIAFLKASK